MFHPFPLIDGSDYTEFAPSLYLILLEDLLKAPCIIFVSLDISPPFCVVMITTICMVTLIVFCVYL